MGQDREDQSKWCEKSLMLIRETLTNIDEGICSKLGCHEYNLIAEFAATFSIKEWALEHGWTHAVRLLTKQSITSLDLLDISKAHKAGASIGNIINLDGTGYAYVRVPEVFEFKAELPSLKLNNAFTGNGVRLIVEALQSGLKLDRLNLGRYHGENIRFFLEAIPTPTKLNGLAMQFYYWEEDEADVISELVRLVFQKLESGKALQYLELLDLSNSGITNWDVESIACSLRAGVKLKMLDISYNYIDNEGAILLAGAIKQSLSLDLECLLMCGNDIEEKGWAALEEAQKITRVRFLKLNQKRFLDVGFPGLKLRCIKN